MKHYQLRSEGESSQPSLLWEIRLDIQDVRSGYRGSDSGLFLGPFLDEADVDWSEDLVKRLKDPDLREIGPPRKVTWPASAALSSVTSKPYAESLSRQSSQ